MKVQITIRGRPYTVRSSEDDIDLVAIARYVDARMEEVASRSRASDDYTVALLAALNIAEDFERHRRRTHADLGDLDREVSSALALVEAAVPGAEPSEPS